MNTYKLQQQKLVSLIIHDSAYNKVVTHDLLISELVFEDLLMRSVRPKEINYVDSFPLRELALTNATEEIIGLLLLDGSLNRSDKTILELEVLNLKNLMLIREKFIHVELMFEPLDQD